MIVVFDHSFGKSLDKLDDKRVKTRFKSLIESMEKANTLSDIPGIKAMKGYSGFYRIRIGSYRAGVELTKDNEILLILIAHRKEIYNRFP